MIGFNHLGGLGRLGNQMFEFAALRGIAAEHGYDICIPPAGHKTIENYSLHECFNLNHVFIIISAKREFRIQKKSFLEGLL